MGTSFWDKMKDTNFDLCRPVPLTIAGLFLLILLIIAGASDTVGSFTGGMFESVPEEVFPVPRLSIQTKSCPEHSTSAVVSYWVRKGVEMEDTLIEATAENPSGQTQDGDQPPLSPPFRSSEDIRGRVIGGTLADVKNFPWQVSLHVGFSHQCGGSILTKSWILTAGHCQKASKTPDEWNAYTGITYQDDAEDYRTGEKNSPGHYSKISAILYPNPMWDEDSYQTDIALMKLTTPIEEYNDYQMPICIPDSSIEGHFETEMQMQVSGFGDVQNRPDGNFQFSDKLKSVMVPMVSSELCQSWYGSDFEVLPDQICAGHAEGKRDACVGDSGGPMVRHFDVEGSDVYYQIGIVSFGFECGKPKEPGVYSRVTTYRDWIYSAMQHYDSYLNN